MALNECTWHCTDEWLHPWCAVAIEEQSQCGGMINILTPSHPTVPLVTPCVSCSLDSGCHCPSLHYHSSYWSRYVVSLGAECYHDNQWESAQLTDFLRVLEVSPPSFYDVCGCLGYLSLCSWFSFLFLCHLLFSLLLTAVLGCRWIVQELSAQRRDSKVWRTIYTVCVYVRERGESECDWFTELVWLWAENGHLVMEYKDAKEECVEVSSEQREVDDQSTGEPHDLRHHRVEQKLGHTKASKQKTYHNNIQLWMCAWKSMTL